LGRHQRPRPLTASSAWSALSSDPTPWCRPHSSWKCSVSDRYPALSRRLRQERTSSTPDNGANGLSMPASPSREGRPTTARPVIGQPSHVAAACRVRHCAVQRLQRSTRQFCVTLRSTRGTVGGRAAGSGDGGQAPAGRLPEAPLVSRGLLRAFHRLRPELRQILSLAATGLSSLEIAASLSLPRPTVATRLRLARRLFARALTRSRRWPR
jgi:hypothetical protein